MNANGIGSATVSASSVSSGQAASAAIGKTGSAGGFAGALVQAIDGSGGAGASVTGSGVPAGLMGLLGLLGNQAGEASSGELLDLLSGLTEQLNSLDPNADLPAELQDQLAALLLMIQNLLNVSGTELSANDGDVPATLTIVPNMPAGQVTAAPNAQHSLVPALRQSLLQLTERLTKGETFNVQASQLAETLKQTLNAVQQQTAVKASAEQAGGNVSTEKATAETTGKPAAADKTAAVSQTAEAAIEVQTEVRKTVLPLRNPSWQFQPVSATEQAAQTDGTAAAVESADASGQNGSALAWTFLKDGNAVIPTSATANAAAPAQVPVQQFAEQMGKFLVKQFILTQGHGTSEAKISLHPEHLGQVDIKIMIQNGLLTAQFVTENGAARDMLETQMSQLRTALQGQGLQVDKMEVVQQSASTSAESAAFFQQRQEHSGTGHQGGNSKGRGSRGVYDDSAAFEAELDRTAFLREIGYGSSLNVTA